jgi:hypothetical protein
MSTKKDLFFFFTKEKPHSLTHKGSEAVTRLLCSYLVGDDLTRRDRNTKPSRCITDTHTPKKEF